MHCAVNVSCQEMFKNLQQGLGFGTGSWVASNGVVYACAKNKRLRNAFKAGVWENYSINIILYFSLYVG